MPLLVVLAGCSKAQPYQTIPKVESISFSTENFHEIYDPSDTPFTRTSVKNNNEFIWASHDTVGIYPETGSQVYFAMESGAGAKTAIFDGGGWTFKPSFKYYSYYPFIGDIYLDRHNIMVNYDGQKQPGINSIEHIGPYAFMYTPATYSEDSNLNFGYKHLGCLIRPKLTLPAGNYTRLSVTAPSKVFVEEGYFDLQCSEPTIIGTKYTNHLDIELENITLKQETQFMVYLASAPVNLKGIEIIVSVFDNNGVEYQCKKTPSGDYDKGAIGGLTCAIWEKIYPGVQVTSVRLNRTSVSMKANEHKTLEATVIPQDATNKNVLWSSSNTEVADIDSKGEITAKKDGTTVITAKTEDGNHTASCNVVVNSDGNNENPDIGEEIDW